MSSHRRVSHLIDKLLPTSTQNYVAYIGIDWADRKHDIALYDCASGKNTSSKLVLKTF